MSYNFNQAKWLFKISLTD